MNLHLERNVREGKVSSLLRRSYYEKNIVSYINDKHVDALNPLSRNFCEL